MDGQNVIRNKTMISNFYGGFVTATCSWRNPAETKPHPIILIAHNQRDAETKAGMLALRHFPEADGWTDHKFGLTSASEGMLDKLMAKVQETHNQS